MDQELLNADERKEKIRTHVENLSKQMNQILRGQSERLKRLEQLKPNFMPEFRERWDELDKRYLEYLEGKIEWDGECMQMEFMPLSKVPYPRLEIDRDISNYGRELFNWVVMQTKDI